jgi:hypothetical protein
MDGQRMKGGIITLGRDLVKHQITVRMGNPDPLENPTNRQ